MYKFKMLLSNPPALFYDNIFFVVTFVREAMGPYGPPVRRQPSPSVVVFHTFRIVFDIACAVFRI